MSSLSRQWTKVQIMIKFMQPMNRQLLPSTDDHVGRNVSTRVNYFSIATLSPLEETCSIQTVFAPETVLQTLNAASPIHQIKRENRFIRSRFAVRISPEIPMSIALYDIRLCYVIVYIPTNLNISLKVLPFLLSGEIFGVSLFSFLHSNTLLYLYKILVVDVARRSNRRFHVTLQQIRFCKFLVG